MEILFDAGLRQAQTDNRKKIETKSGTALTDKHKTAFQKNRDKYQDLILNT